MSRGKWFFVGRAQGYAAGRRATQYKRPSSIPDTGEGFLARRIREIEAQKRIKGERYALMLLGISERIADPSISMERIERKISRSSGSSLGYRFSDSDIARAFRVVEDKEELTKDTSSSVDIIVGDLSEDLKNSIWAEIVAEDISESSLRILPSPRIITPNHYDLAKKWYEDGYTEEEIEAKLLNSTTREEIDRLVRNEVSLRRNFHKLFKNEIKHMNEEENEAAVGGFIIFCLLAIIFISFIIWIF